MPEVYNVVPTRDPENPPLVDSGAAPVDKKQSMARKKSSIRHHPHMSKCEKCGHMNQPTFVYPTEIYPPPRPADRIRPDNKNFIGYIVLLAVLIFLFYCAVKYLP